MSLHGWVGPGKLRELGHDRAHPPTIAEPTSPITDIVLTEESVKLHTCTVDGCGRRFKLRALVARHFNSNHEDLRKDKDSWREYTEEIWD